MSTRRAILQLIGSAPVVGASARAEIAAMLSSPAIAAAVALAGSGSCGGPAAIPQGPGSHLGIIGKQLSRLRRSFDADMWAKRNVRTGGLDPDIACMRSVSHVNKAHAQIERDNAEADLTHHIDRTLFGE